MPILKVTVNIPPMRDLTFSVTQLERGCLDTVNQVLDQADKDFAKTYATWTTKPVFTKTPAKNQSGVISGEDFTMDANYRRINDGTEGHLGGPTKKKAVSLRKRSPKTTPGKLGSTAGVEREGRPVRRGSWRVQGITPRHFDKLVATRAQHNLNVATAQMLSQLLK
jgi:hypothetical protein